MSFNNFLPPKHMFLFRLRFNSYKVFKSLYLAFLFSYKLLFKIYSICFMRSFFFLIDVSC